MGNGHRRLVGVGSWRGGNAGSAGPIVASEESEEACFVLLLRKAVAHFAHFARRDTRSAETEEMGGSDDGNAHTCMDKSTNFGVGFLPLFGEPEVIVSSARSSLPCHCVDRPAKN